jgi:hypothetical protein
VANEDYPGEPATLSYLPQNSRPACKFSGNAEKHYAFPELKSLFTNPAEPSLLRISEFAAPEAKSFYWIDGIIIAITNDMHDNDETAGSKNDERLQSSCSGVPAQTAARCQA